MPRIKTRNEAPIGAPANKPNQNPSNQSNQPTSILAGGVINYNSQRVGVFIDVQNMYYSAKNLFNAKVNFLNIVREAIGSRQAVRAIAYVVETPQQHEVRFLDALRAQGIELKERDLQVFSSGVKKADWDVGIAVDAIAISEVLDVIVLVSGDGDYLPLVEYLQQHGRRVEAMGFRSTSSSKLVESVDKFVDLGERPELFLIRDNKPGQINNGGNRLPPHNGNGGSKPATFVPDEHLGHMETPREQLHAQKARRRKRTIL